MCVCVRVFIPMLILEMRGGGGGGLQHVFELTGEPRDSGIDHFTVGFIISYFRSDGDVLSNRHPINYQTN